MHHQGTAAVPAAHEADQIGDMLLARHDVAVERRGNIMQPQPQMIFRRDAVWTHHIGFVADQRHDMARAGIFDDFMQARERADVNHGIRNLASGIDCFSLIHIGIARGASVTITRRRVF